MDALNLEQNKTFGVAIQALKDGKQIARKGWNGKNMFVYLNHGSHYEAPGKEERETYIGGVRNQLFVQGAEGTVTRMPNLNMKAADGSTVTGWLASQTDILAEDWNVLN